MAEVARPALANPNQSCEKGDGLMPRVSKAARIRDLLQVVVPAGSARVIAAWCASCRCWVKARRFDFARNACRFCVGGGR